LLTETDLEKKERMIEEELAVSKEPRTFRWGDKKKGLLPPKTGETNGTLFPHRKLT